MNAPFSWHETWAEITVTFFEDGSSADQQQVGQEPVRSVRGVDPVQAGDQQPPDDAGNQVQ